MNGYGFFSLKLYAHPGECSLKFELDRCSRFGGVIEQTDKQTHN